MTWRVNDTMWRLFQRVAPDPKRHLQALVVQHGLCSGLDIGTGEASMLSPLRQFGVTTAGIDIDIRMLVRAREKRTHNYLCVADLSQPPLKKRFDVVVASHVIEHLDKHEGFEFLRTLESLARFFVYVETPHGFLEQSADEQEIGQRHRSGWFPHDFAGRGYAVYGAGIPGLRSERGAPVLPEAMVRMLDLLAQPVLFRLPKLSRTLSAIKFTDRGGNIRRV